MEHTKLLSYPARSSHIDEDGNETPLHMLVVKPGAAEIVKAINYGMRYNWNRLWEV